MGSKQSWEGGNGSSMTELAVDGGVLVHNACSLFFFFFSIFKPASESFFPSILLRPFHPLVGWFRAGDPVF